MSDKKETNYAAWILGAVVLFQGYLMWNQQKAKPVDPDVPKPVVVSIEKATAGVLAAMKAENARVFTEAANKVEKGELKTDRELFEFVQPATKEAREQANKPFDLAFDEALPRNDDGSFIGKEIEAGKVLRKVARAW
tara:strand:- start:5223 stop:5633 length:411 start_codon:yes stop_codon:yes gene_type:complete